MANRKLMWWARLTLRKTCGHCGELYATTAATDEDGTAPACQHCADWIAAGSPEEYDDTAVLAAYDSLPWLLRHRPSVRQLNCCLTQYYGSTSEQDCVDAENRFWDEFYAASLPVQWTVTFTHVLGRAWRWVCFRVGIAADWARITVTRPNCAHCAGKATTVSRLCDDSPERTSLCDECRYAINDGTELPGGAR